MPKFWGWLGLNAGKHGILVLGIGAVMTLVLGYTSSLPRLHDFGVVVGTNVAVALLGALVAQPPPLVWAEGHGWATRELLHPKWESQQIAHSPLPSGVARMES